MAVKQLSHSPFTCPHAATALKEVSLNSTLIDGNQTYPQQMVVFTCEAINTTILEWRSNDYIGVIDLQIYSGGPRDIVNSSDIPSTYATRDNVTHEVKYGENITTIKSRLFIRALNHSSISSVSCWNDGQGPRETIYFSVKGIVLGVVPL